MTPTKTKLIEQMANWLDSSYCVIKNDYVINVIKLQSNFNELLLSPILCDLSRRHIMSDAVSTAEKNEMNGKQATNNKKEEELEEDEISIASESSTQKSVSTQKSLR